MFIGGGFTKDYLYLSGLRNAIRLHKEESMDALLVGKTSFEFKGLLDELISRGILFKPKYIPKAFQVRNEREPIIDYLLSSIH